MLDVIHGLAAGKVTWSQFAQITKKGLIRRERKEPPLPPDDAIPLADALQALRTMLAQAGVDAERPDPRKAWSTFSGFAARPVSAAPLSVESDICLFRWGIHDSEEGPNVECSFTRQFVLHDADSRFCMTIWSSSASRCSSTPTTQISRLSSTAPIQILRL